MRRICQQILVVTCRSLCGRRDTSAGQVADLFCSILPTVTGCIRYTERLWGMGASRRQVDGLGAFGAKPVYLSSACPHAPQELLFVSRQNSERRAAPGTSAGLPVGAHDPMIPDHTTHTHALFLRRICQQILVVTCRSLCGRRDTSAGQVADLFCSILPTVTGCIRYTERLWGMGASRRQVDGLGAFGAKPVYLSSACPHAPQELLFVSRQNSERRAAPGTSAGLPVGAHDPMIPDHTEHTRTLLAPNLPADPSGYA